MKRFLAITFVFLFATAAVAQAPRTGLSMFLFFGTPLQVPVVQVPVVTCATTGVVTPGEAVCTLTATNSPTSWAIVSQSCSLCYAINNSGHVTGGANAANIFSNNTITVTATNAAGTGPQQIITINNNGSLPPGVSLQAIDGESMINATTMSHNYYNSNGFTVAANASFNGKSWDDPSYIPMGSFLSTMDGSNQTCPSGTCTTQAIWADLGWTMQWAVDTSYVSSVARAAGLWALGGGPTGDCNGGGSLQAGSGVEIVGWYTADEPADYATATNCISTTSNALTNTRFFQTTGTINWALSGPPSGTPGADTMTAFLFTGVATPNTTLRHFGLFGNDVYFNAYDDFTQGNVTKLYNVNGLGTTGTLATNAQMRRGSNYGDYVDTLRNGACGNGGTGGLIPISVIIETGGPFDDVHAIGGYIQPPELNWAVWQSLIHGARGVDFFDHSFGGPAPSNNNMYDSYYQTAGNYAAGISMYAQIKATVARVNEHATKLLSPTALGYATVSPASSEITPLPPCALSSGTSASGQKVINLASVPSWVAAGMHLSQPDTGAIPSSATVSSSTSTTVTISQNLTTNITTGLPVNFQGTNAWNTGFDIVSKYVSGTFYIFASARAAETATNISATFTVNDPGATSVTVLDESRSINIVGGHFTDNFATAYTVHIYQVNH